MRNREIRGAFLALLWTASAAALNPPALVIDAPPELRSTAEQVRSYEPSRLGPMMELLGAVDGGDPIQVLIAGEESELAKSAPPWISGWAFGDRGVIVLLPARAETYPDDGLEELLRHEIAHVLITRSAGGREVPRWFNEGLAMFASRGWTLEDRSRLMVQLIAAEQIPLSRVSGLFEDGEPAVTRAYAFSGAFVRDLIIRHGKAVPAAILHGLASGATFSQAFLDATGVPLDSAEASFWRRQNLWNRWVPFLTSSIALWMAVTLLALWAIRRHRARNAEVIREWEEEERRLTELDS